mgnify:CR=1 FL=1
MSFILADMLSNKRADGYYAGRNKKYYDMINIAPFRDGAKKFEDAEEAQKVADALNDNGKSGYNFEVKPERLGDEQ